MLRYFVSLCFALPIFLSSLISFYFIDYPAEFKFTPYLLIGISICIFAFDIFYKGADRRNYISYQAPTQRTNSLLILLGYLIISLCLLDLGIHGFVIFDPDPMAYFTFTRFERHLRHFSSLVWILAPLAFFIRGKMSRNVFLIAAVAFPILVLDRNRLLFSLFSIVATLLLFDKFAKRRLVVLGLILVISLGGLFTFSILGKHRAKEAMIENLYMSKRSEQIRVMQLSLQSSIEACTLPAAIPLSEKFVQLSSPSKLLALYISAPIFNLATLDYCNFRNSNLIKAQFVPQYPKVVIAEQIPLVSLYLNVATELLPFFTYGGWAVSVFVLLATFFILFGLVQAVQNRFNIFLYLVFLRISYCGLFFNFAPQLFTWSTLGFVIVMFILAKLSAYLNQENNLFAGVFNAVERR